ncbi:hypothetical protein D9613_003127 [Agrocybe pediades]|uniref:Uncharacterized protein n=1 Tax=Agrocybe pediades TaxID=84607 RepID=A0A8H4QNN9_9AGAR|nr:hypothetical protein D9613_003127 [Agrocybe pediades]
MLEALSVSDVLGYASIASWLGAQFPQVIENVRRQSCEGLALPFLANWLLGDISNLIGCILTHQLPFQTWLAAYFVCVDCTLVAQYIYYYKAPKGPSSALGHMRSATTPVGTRRMSFDRGASRYRALSMVASNVASAAALAAQQEEQADRGRSRSGHPIRSARLHGLERSTSYVPQISGNEEEDYEDDLPTAMTDSFRSEGGRAGTSKRVSWSIERHRNRASSVGRSIRPTTPGLPYSSNDQVDATVNSDSMHHEIISPRAASTDSTMVTTNIRSSKASRKGSTMVFLGTWALFGIGTLAGGRRSLPSSSMTDIGRVLSSNTYVTFNNVLIAHMEHDMRIPASGNTDFKDIDTVTLHTRVDTTQEHEPHDDHPDEPSSEQVIGRIFAWLCTTLYLTSRLPQIWKNYARKSVEGLSMYLFVFAFFGNVFYVASILVSPKRFLPPPEASKYIRESIPYLLGSGGTLLFDITIVGQSFCYRPKHRKHLSVSHRVVDEEEAGLLSADVSAHPSGSDSAILNRGRTSRTRSVG